MPGSIAMHNTDFLKEEMIKSYVPPNDATADIKMSRFLSVCREPDKFKWNAPALATAKSSTTNYFVTENRSSVGPLV